MELDPIPGLVCRQGVPWVRVNSVDLVSKRSQPFGDFGRIAVAAAIEVGVITKGEENETHYPGGGATLVAPLWATR